MSQVTSTQRAQTLSTINTPEPLRACPYGISVKKATLVGLACLLLAQLPTASAQGIAATVGAVGAAATLKTFHPSLARFMHPNLMTNTEGNRYCQLIEGIHFSFEECDRVSALLDQNFRLSDPALYREMVDHVRQDPHSKGISLAVIEQPAPPTQIKLVTVGNNPQIYKNHQKALQFLETEVLKTGDFFTRSSANIVETVKEAHKILMHQLPLESGQAGKLRTENVFVTRDHVEKTAQGFKKELLANGGSREDVRSLRTSLEKIKLYQSFDKALPHFSENELATWKKIGHLATPPEQVSKEIKKFAETFKARMQLVLYEEANVVETAAWVHQEIGRIHPFTDGNGRLARAWMNAVLQLRGIQGVLFYDEDAYTEAVRTDQRAPGHFTQFLEEIIQWNERSGFRSAPESPETPLE